MKTSTEIGSFARIVGEESAVELVAKAGFDAWDFSMLEMCRWDRKNGKPFESSHPLGSKEYLKFARKLKQIGLDNGIVCNQSHAPFPIRFIGKDNLLRAIECTAEAGGKICVIHPDNDKTPEENAEIYNELLPFAKQCGVKIATENMWNWNKELDCVTHAACSTPDNFLAHIQAVNDPYLVACLDIGHAEMMGETVSAVEMIKTLGNKIEALHIHDNDKVHDSHQMPGTMQINFAKIIETLHGIKYNGYYTLEAYNFFAKSSAADVLPGLIKLRKSLDMFE